MTQLTIRTTFDGATPDGLVLDFDPYHDRATIDFGLAFVDNWRPTAAALDLLRVAAGVFCADRKIPRTDATDQWTRDLDLSAPMTGVSYTQLDGVAEALCNALSFLTSDRWTVDLVTTDVDGFGAHPRATPGGLAVDIVTLFSGGLDSLCGTIDLLEANPDARIALIAHHETGGQALSSQRALHDALARHYGAERLRLLELFVQPAPPRAGQARTLPESVEATTRARSLLFIAAAVAAASAADLEQVFVPENGYISLNVPLTRARTASRSTRTTHPHFFHLLHRTFDAAAIDVRLTNPYQHQTKGEMLAGSANPQLLETLTPLSVSCAHPEVGRWAQRPQGDCGYCYPCIIRRAAIHAAGWTDNGTYSWDVTAEAVMLDRSSDRGRDLRAVVNAIHTERPDSDVLRNGPLHGDRAELLAMWRRGNAELRAWLHHNATGQLANLINAL